MAEEPVFGIDLGTTYSCIAFWNAERKAPEVLTNPSTNATTLASVVCAKENGKGGVEWLVGEKAEKRQTGRDYKSVVSFAKNDIANDAGCENHKYRREYPTVNGTSLGPIDISAAILKELTFNNSAVLEHNGGIQKPKVVITVPAYFTAGARERTKQAGILAGLDVIGMVEEPVAAALSYGSRFDVKNKIVMVYDLGGGTFDVSIVAFDNKGEGKVLVKKGNPERGGKDWDNQFGYYVWKKFCEISGDDEDKLTLSDFEGEAQSDESRKLAHQFRALAKQAKEELTNLDSTCVDCRDGDDYQEELDVTREEFDQVTADLLNDTMTLVNQVRDIFNEQNPGQKLDVILLVGGSTFMPQVRVALESKFPGTEIQLEEPNWAVAKGAAIFASTRPDKIGQEPGTEPGGIGPSGKEAGLGGRLAIQNIASMSYGIKLMNEMTNKPFIDILIQKDTPLPAEGEDTVGTLVDGQTALRFDVYESDIVGKELELEQGELLSSKDKPATMQFPKPLEKGHPVTVKMLMDGGGYLHITAVDGKDPSHVFAFDVPFKGVMSDTEIRERSEMLGRSK